MQHLAVAIDGPSGAGKSTIARAVAKRLGITYVDTGALYRAIGLGVLGAGIALEDATAIAQLLPHTAIDLQYIDGVQQVFLNGQNVSDAIRTQEVAQAASAVAKIPAVRQFLLSTQREMAQKYDVIMDGRDIGTVVLPFAQVKIFFSASPEKRALRRQKELEEKGTVIALSDILAQMQARDIQDTNRAEAPLRQAEDAVFLDNGDMTLAQSIEAVLTIIQKQTNRSAT